MTHWETLMKSRYWEKLWHDIIDDIKLGPLPGELKWRFVQLIILAGQQGDDGRLPDVPDMAFRLRLTEEQLRSDLPTLARRELVELDADGRWLVSNYVKRQAAMDANERVRRHRMANRGSASASAANSCFAEEEIEEEAETEADIVTHNVTNRYKHVTSSLLRDAAISRNRTTAPLFDLDPEYVRAHLEAAGSKVGLAIRRMLDGDPAPQPRVAIPADLADIIQH